MRRWIAAGVTAGVGLVLLPLGASSPAQAAPPSPYTLVWSDEFNGTSVDSSKWQRSAPDVNGDVPYSYNADTLMTPGQSTVSGGSLRLLCSRNPITYNGTNYTYQTAGVTTRNKYEFTYGWAEASIRIMDVENSDTAFWMMPKWDNAANYWSFVGLNGGFGAEVDIMEHWNPWAGISSTSNLHWGGYGSSHQSAYIGSFPENSTVYSQFHLYGVEWQPGRLSFYMDGVQRYTYTGSGIPYGPETLILSTGVSNTGSPVNAADLPATTLVDYIRVYQRADTNFPPSSTRWYTIKNRNSGKALDVTGASTADAANVVQWSETGRTNQQWQFTPLGNGYYTIKNRNSGLLMDIYGQQTGDGARNIQYHATGGENQQWQIIPMGGGYYKILNRNSGKILDITGASTADGAQDIQYHDTAGTNQQWSFTLQG